MGFPIQDVLSAGKFIACDLLCGVPRQLTLFLGLPKIMHLIKPLGLINPGTASRVQGKQC